MKIKKKNEASVVGGIKGPMGAFGAKIIRRKGKKENNRNKPYGEPELFENAVIKSIMDEEDMGEVVRQRGNKWIIFDDDTGAEVGSFPKRGQAWIKQRQLRRAKLAKKNKPERDPTKPQLVAKSKVADKPKIAQPKDKKLETINYLKTEMKKVLNENFLQYVFEQPQNDQQTLIWDKFIENLSSETLMSDQKLKNILVNLAKSESKVLENAYGVVEDALNKTKRFEVSNKKLKKDESTNEMSLFFNVKLKESKKSLIFSLIIENGKPLIFISDDTRQELNTTNTPDAKSLRSELIHIQETVLNQMDDIVQISQKRDTYLKKLENEVDDFITKMSPLQINMIKFLIKSKYRSIK